MEGSKSRQLLDVDQLRWGRVSDWAQLVRLPNLFTLLSNCAAATILSVGAIGPWTAIVPIWIVSVLAYWAGMLLNDVADIEEDKRHRPDRPLPSGRVSPALAGHVATGMLMLGPLILLMVAAYHRTIDQLWMMISIAACLLLWISIRIYNSPVKATLLGPGLMGLCRALNIAMVGFAVLAVHWGNEFSMVESFPQTLVAYAAAMGVYICGVTTYARREEQLSSSATLLMGTLLQAAGLAMLAGLPFWETGRQVHWFLDPRTYYPILIGLVGLTVLNRAISGIMRPVSRRVQLAVRHALLSLILLDASVVLMWAGTWYGVAVVILMLPALLGALKFRTT